jgi:hypothetical protein
MEQTLRLPDGWAEAEFERGRYGREDVEGFTVTFEAASGDASLDVLPVRYERTAGTTHLRGLTSDLDHRGSGSDVHGPSNVDQRTAFCLRATFTPFSSTTQMAYTVTRSADDALAVACWLADGCDNARELQRQVEVHGGFGVGTTSAAELSDDELLDARTADAPDRCLYTGSKTSSHAVTLPLRYAVAIDDYPLTGAGVPRVPTTFDRFEAAVSHDAFTDRSLPESFDEGFDREAPGVYTLAEDHASALVDGTVGYLCLRRLGED